MQRIDAVRVVSSFFTTEDLCISSLGALRQDWWNLSPRVGNTFYPAIIGSVTTTALGLALALPHRRILALETDGSVLMNTGALCTLGSQRPGNLTVVVMDNELYESIGGAPTLTSHNTDLAGMAAGAGCVNAMTVRDPERLRNEFERMWLDDQMGYIVAKIEHGKHPWPLDKLKSTDGVEDKYNFIRYIEKLENVVIHPGSQR
jgi:thiamine pyrophosphate-dependent acetolactate synthase large subunit-like protein